MSKSLQAFPVCGQSESSSDKCVGALEGEWISREESEHDDFIKKVESDLNEIQKRRFEVDRKIARYQALGKAVMDIGSFL